MASASLATKVPTAASASALLLTALPAPQASSSSLTALVLPPVVSGSSHLLTPFATSVRPVPTVPTAVSLAPSASPVSLLTSSTPTELALSPATQATLAQMGSASLALLLPFALPARGLLPLALPVFLTTSSPTTLAPRSAVLASSPFKAFVNHAVQAVENAAPAPPAALPAILALCCCLTQPALLPASLDPSNPMGCAKSAQLLLTAASVRLRLPPALSASLLTTSLTPPALLLVQRATMARVECADPVTRRPIVSPAEGVPPIVHPVFLASSGLLKAPAVATVPMATSKVLAVCAGNATQWPIAVSALEMEACALPVSLASSSPTAPVLSPVPLVLSLSMASVNPASLPVCNALKMPLRVLSVSLASYC